MFCCVAVQAAQHLSAEHTQESAPDTWDSGYLLTLACLKDSFTQASHSQSCLQNQWGVTGQEMGSLLQICGTRLKADWHEPSTQSCLNQIPSPTWVMWLLHELRFSLCIWDTSPLLPLLVLVFSMTLAGTCIFFWDLTALWSVNLAPWVWRLPEDLYGVVGL